MFEEPNTIPTEDDMNAMYAYEQSWGPEPEGEDYAEEERYYQRPYEVSCSKCPRTETLTHAECDRRNWHLAPQVLCPPCAIKQTNWEAAVAVGRARMLVEQIEKSNGHKRFKLRKQFDLADCPF